MKVDELRNTLHAHAEEAGTDAVTARLASVHRRVALARRRRRAALTGTALAAVAAVGLAVVPPLVSQQAPRPADPTPASLAGHRVPATQTATGYTYDYAAGVESRLGRKRLTITLPDSDRPRLLMWASSDRGDRPTVEVTDTYGAREVSAPGGFDRYLYVEPGQDRIVLRQSDAGPHTRLALATYRLSKNPPPGVSNGTVTYRAHVLGSDLLGARFGARGESDLRLRVTLPQEPVWFSDVCYGSRAGYEVSVDGRMLIGTDCSATGAPYDAASASAMSTTARLGRPGQTVTVRVHLVTGLKHARPTADPGVVLGIGVYADRSQTVTVADTTTPARTEHAGHEWAAGAWYATDPGAGSVTTLLQPSDRPRLVSLVTNHLAASGWKVRLTADGQPVLAQQEDPGGSSQSGDDYVVQPGQTPRLVLRVTKGMTPRAQVAVLLSDLVH